MEWCECVAGEGIVGEEVREGRDDGGALRGAVDAGESRGVRHPECWGGSEGSGAWPVSDLLIR